MKNLSHLQKGLTALGLSLLFCAGCIKEPGIPNPSMPTWLLSKITRYGPANQTGGKAYSRIEFQYNQHNKPWLRHQYKGTGKSWLWDTANIQKTLELVDTVFYNDQGQPIQRSIKYLGYPPVDNFIYEYNIFYYGSDDNLDSLGRYGVPSSDNPEGVWVGSTSYRYEQTVVTKIDLKPNPYIGGIDIDSGKLYYGPGPNLLSFNNVFQYSGYDNKPNPFRMLNIDNGQAFPLRSEPIFAGFEAYTPWISANNFTAYSNGDRQLSRDITYNADGLPVKILSVYPKNGPWPDTAITWYEYREVD